MLDFLQRITLALQNAFGKSAGGIHVLPPAPAEAVVSPVAIAPAPITVVAVKPVAPSAPALSDRMRLFVKRGKSDKGCTIGKLYVDGMFECFTLEDVVREVAGEPVAKWKVLHETAIPVGTYDVTVTFSPHFKRDTPAINNVPGFEYIRIHPGNFAKDTEGCLLVGETENVSDGNIGSSIAAFNTLLIKIQKAISTGKKVTITYQNS